MCTPPTFKLLARKTFNVLFTFSQIFPSSLISRESFLEKASCGNSRLKCVKNATSRYSNTVVLNVGSSEAHYFRWENFLRPAKLNYRHFLVLFAFQLTWCFVMNRGRFNKSRTHNNTLFILHSSVSTTYLIQCWLWKHKAALPCSWS